jgi:hypothetical protein
MFLINNLIIYIYLIIIGFIILASLLLLPPFKNKIKKMSESENMATLSSILILSGYIFITVGIIFRFN